MAQKPCTSSLSAQTANFKHGDRTYPVTLCVCKGGPYDIKGLADEVARVPDFLLYFVKGVLITMTLEQSQCWSPAQDHSQRSLW